jgi:hypothetical protein
VKKFLLGFKLAMTVIYIGMGMYLITHPNVLSEFLNVDITLIVGVLLIAFGAFRGYRAWFIERNV